MPVNTSITAGALQAPQQQNPIQQLAALMQIMQAQKQGQLTDMEIQQKQQMLPIQLQQAQAAANKAQRVESFYSPQNMQQFMQPQYAAVAPGPDGMGPSREAGPSVLDFDKLLNAGAAQGVIDPEKLADHRAKQTQAKAAMEATKQQREDALMARLYDIDARAQDRQLSREQAATLAAERNRISEMLIETRRDQTTFAQNKESRKLQQAMPQAELRMKSISQNMDRLAAIAQELHDHEGISRITGTVFGRTPDVSNKAIDAAALRESLTSNVWQSALQAMREASKTGGAVGSVSNREGDRLESSLGALSRVQTTDQFKKELKRVIDQVRMSKELIQNAFEEQFGGARTTEPASGGGVQAPQPGSRNVTVDGKSYTARKAANGKFYVETAPGKWAEVRD